MGSGLLYLQCPRLMKLCFTVRYCTCPQNALVNRPNRFFIFIFLLNLVRIF